MTSSDTTTAHPIVLSPTLDDIAVDSALYLLDGLLSDGHSIDEAAATTAEYLAETVATYTVPDDFDPTDAELERSLNGPDAPEAHRVAWALHQELRS